jgi:hypothetical protein
MYKLFPGKSPTQMRREAERRATPKRPQPAGKIDPSKYPPMHSDTRAEIDATRDWLAHIDAGRIGVK